VAASPDLRFPSPHELPPEQFTWLVQSRNEYGAAAVMAQLTHWLVALGMSPDSIQRATRLINDEVLHAKLCRGVYLAAGGEERPVVLVDEALSHYDDPDAPIVWRAVTAAGELAVEETVALPVFQARQRAATHAEPVAAVKQIIKDEAFHRAFGWDLYDEFIERLGVEAVRAWSRPRLGWWLRAYLLAHPGDDEPVYSDEQMAWGLIQRRDHWNLMRQCVDEVVLPRFRKRGILEEGVDADELERQTLASRGHIIPPWSVAAPSA